MKKLSKYIGIFLTVVLMGAFSACNILDPNHGMEDLGLGIKVFFPTKVVAGQPMTINGSGFLGAREIVFPGNVKVTDFEIVSNDMIRVTAPNGIAAAGGKLVINTADQSAESPLELTLGKTVVSGFSKQEGESISVGDILSIYGTDLEFINSIEFIDTDGNPLIITEDAFYRKSSGEIMVKIPKKVLLDTFSGSVHTYDGQAIAMPDLKYEQGGGGHWEIKKTTIWQGDGSAGEVAWNGIYRYALVDHDGNHEAIAEIPADVWEKMKTETFYVTLSGDNPQIRVTSGWWSVNLVDPDIQPGNDLLVDNEDGTWTLTVNLSSNADLVALLDEQHLLFTGSGYSVLELYFESVEWVDGGGHMEIVKTPVWQGDGSAGEVAWNGIYRYALVDHDGNHEAIAEIPADVWERMKSETFYVTLSGDNPQIRVTTGWWSVNLVDPDIQPGNDLLVANEDGTWTLTVDLSSNADLVALLDEQHLLFTGSGYSVLEIYFQSEQWVDGGDSGPKEVVIWEGDGSAGEVAWNGTYRYALVDHDGNHEAIAEIPADVWEKMKTTTFYATLTGDSPQIRVTTGWWSVNLVDPDIQPGNDLLVANEDGTWTLTVDLSGNADLVALLDEQHLLFTGSGYAVRKLYFFE